MQNRSIVISHRGGPFHRTADRSEPFGRQASKSDSATETSLKTPTGWIRPSALEIPPDRLRLREAAGQGECSCNHRNNCTHRMSPVSFPGTTHREEIGLHPRIIRLCEKGSFHARDPTGAHFR